VARQYVTEGLLACGNGILMDRMRAIIPAVALDEIYENAVAQLALVAYLFDEGVSA
jgi:hypothetical protein